MRIFTAALATETNTFSPIFIDRRGFEDSLYAPPGQHPLERRRSPDVSGEPPVAKGLL